MMITSGIASSPVNTMTHASARTLFGPGPLHPRHQRRHAGQQSPHQPDPSPGLTPKSSPHPGWPLWIADKDQALLNQALTNLPDGFDHTQSHVSAFKEEQDPGY